MKAHHQTRILFLVSLLQLAAATASSDELPGVQARDDELVVAPQSSTFVIRCEDVLGNDGAACPAAMADVRVVRPPLHGVLEPSGDGWTFELDEHYHTLGSDSFSYSLAAGGGAETLTYATVVLLAGRYAVAAPPVMESFEGELDPAFTWTGDVQVLPEAAIAGHKGLRATAAPFLAAVGRHTLPDPPYGDGATSGDDRIKIRPPGGGTGPTPPGKPVTVYALFRHDQVDPTSRVLLRQGASGWEVRAELHASSSHTTTWTPVGPGAHLIEVDWWDGFSESALPPRSGGLLLAVDHVVVGSIAGVGEWDAGTEREIGVAVDPAAKEVVTMDLDDVVLGTEFGAELAPAFVTTLNDDFDDDLSLWETGGGFVNGTFALTAAKGLEITPIPGPPSYLLDTTPQAAAGYYLRFHLDGGSLDIPDGQAMTMLAACGVDGVSFPDDQVRVRLSTGPGGLRLAVVVRESGGMTALPELAIPPAGATVELAWHAAETAMANGLLSVWLDGVLRQQVRTLDNAGRSVESLRLGTFGVEEGTLGSFYVDAFESWARSPTP